MTTETLTRPATFAGAAAERPVWSGICRIAVALHRRMQIHASMGGLGERHLRDIGLTQADLEGIGPAPLGQDASAVLAGARQSRAGNW